MAHRQRSRRSPLGVEMPRGDGRTLLGRRLRQLTVQFEDGLIPPLSAAVRAKVGAAVVLAMTTESMQARLMAGQDVNPADALKLAAGLERLLKDLERAKGKA
jgi:hypothetical protein